MEKRGYLVVFVTYPNEEECASAAKVIIGEGLAACCNIICPVRSIYMWNGEICDEGEVLGIFKVLEENFPPLEERIKSLHSYDLPEVIGIGIEDASKEYLAWLDSTSGSDN